MSPPRVALSEININTIIIVLGFLATIGGGWGAYTSFRAESVLRHASADREISELKARATANAEAIRVMQIANAGITAESAALRREIIDLKADLREVAQLLRQAQDRKP